MNLILKRHPVWLGSLPNPNASTSLLLSGGDGQHVPFPAPLLLAVSPLVRSILADLLPPAFSPCSFSLPDVTEEVLHVILDLLTTGAAGGDHVDRIEEVRQGLEMLGAEVSLVSCHVESIEVGQALDRSFVMVENYSEGQSEEDIKMEVIVELENKISAGDEVVKSKRVRKNGNLKTVRSTRSIHKQEKFPCSLCPQMLSTKRHLARHIKSVHHQIKIPCNICPQKFTQKADLVRHIKAVHELIKFPCNICPQKFTQKANLVTHIKTVHEQIKIPCNQCSKKFSHKVDLVNHIKSVHEKISF